MGCSCEAGGRQPPRSLGVPPEIAVVAWALGNAVATAEVCPRSAAAAAAVADAAAFTIGLLGCFFVGLLLLLRLRPVDVLSCVPAVQLVTRLAVV